MPGRMPCQGVIMRLLTNYDHLLNPEKIFVAFDIETTGLSPNLDRIIELGAVKYQDGKVVETFNELISPGIPLPPESIEVHGITEDMLEGMPPVEEVLPHFLKFVGDGILVAHNAKFDTGFCEPEHDPPRDGYPQT
jgi:DNA polymerase-3 subunit alpha (Gram-positive type)